MSPFIPGTKLQFAWDSTSLGWLKTCPRLYQYSMLEGWASRNPSLHLTFGQHYHKGLERYAKAIAEGTPHDTAVEDLVRLALIETHGWISGDTMKNRETLVRSLIWYCEAFKNDTTKVVTLADGKAAVELSFRLDLQLKPNVVDEDGWLQDDVPGYVMCGHLDSLVEFQGGTYVLDHKTLRNTISSSFFEGFSPDNQMSLYSVAAKVIWNTPVRGVIISAAQIAVGFTRFERGFTYRTNLQMEEWLAETRIWLSQAEAFARDEYWPMNDKSCRFCSFREVCNKDPSVRKNFLETKFEKREWNPLIPR